MIATRIDQCIGSVASIPPGEGREFQIEGRRIAVFHTRSGAVYATDASCPHRNGPLVDGLVGGTTVICPLHAWKFDLRTGESIQGECGIRTYPVRVSDDGRVFVTVE